MSEIAFLRYSPYTSQDSTTKQLVSCFRGVFAGEPWNELLKCPVCSNYWGTKDQELLRSMEYKHCGVELVDYWPEERVFQDLRREIRQDSSAWLAFDGEKVVGFCWGYPVSKSIIEAELKLALPNNMLGCFDHDTIAYQDEVGVLLPYRGRGLAKKMVALRHDDFLAKGLKLGIVRTRQHPEQSVTFSWYTEKLGYKIVGVYPDVDGKLDGRVILSRPLEGLRELLTT